MKKVTDLQDLGGCVRSCAIFHSSCTHSKDFLLSPFLAAMPLTDNPCQLPRTIRKTISPSMVVPFVRHVRGARGIFLMLYFSCCTGQGAIIIQANIFWLVFRGQLPKGYALANNENKSGGKDSKGRVLLTFPSLGENHDPFMLASFKKY